MLQVESADGPLRNRVDRVNQTDLLDRFSHINIKKQTIKRVKTIYALREEGEVAPCACIDE